MRGLSEYVKIVEEIHFTQIRRRMTRIKPSIGNDNDNEEPITLVASGLSTSNKGDYIEEKWIRKKKEFIKLRIVVDANSKKVVSFPIARGNVPDTTKFCPRVRGAVEKYNIDKVYADKAHDSRKNFDLLEDLNVEPAIEIRKNASIRACFFEMR